jgi:hypothetical protein
VARFYANENMSMQMVAELRRLGHDVLTTLGAGKANTACLTLRFWHLQLRKIASYCLIIAAASSISIDHEPQIVRVSFFARLTQI